MFGDRKALRLKYVCRLCLFYIKDYRYFDKDIIDLDAYNINFEHVASSLRLNNIKEVILYEGSGYDGPSITIKADTKSLDLVGWNDRVSSLKIIR